MQHELRHEAKRILRVNAITLAVGAVICCIVANLGAFSSWSATAGDEVKDRPALTQRSSYPSIGNAGWKSAASVR
jgi:hypothetical protein